jgi:hypothetical protein
VGHEAAGVSEDGAGVEAGAGDDSAGLSAGEESLLVSLTAEVLFRLSVTYQPLPLKTTGGA